MENKNTKIAIIAGARPNFMKVAPLVWELKKRKIKHLLINAGQHKDPNMSADFFKEFRVVPHFNLSPSSDSPVFQMLDIMSGLRDIFTKEKPSMVVVVGDVNATLYAALVAHKMKIPIVHVEAGLRSRNAAMPEEINRITVDMISDFLFVSERSALSNLEKEKVSGKKYLVGNIMLDTLCAFLPKIPATKEFYYFATIHRAENVDNKKIFKQLLDALEIIAKDEKIYLTLHPRTKKMAEEFGLLKRLTSIFEVLPPLSYTDTIFYQKNALLVITDSGGIQEESSFLGTPCLTVRTETERPVTVTHGTNVVVGVETEGIIKAYRKLKSKGLKKRKIKIPFWDGRTSERIIKILQNNA